MKPRTVRVAAHDDVSVITEAVRSLGGSVTFHSEAAFGRRYGILEGELGEARIVVYDTAIIAIALTPSTAEALPLLEAALQGAGRPTGTLATERIEDALIIEWDPQHTSVAVIFGVVDVELARLHASRRVSVLTPLSTATAALIAAEGLRAAAISRERVLEVRLHEAGIDA